MKKKESIKEESNPIVQPKRWLSFRAFGLRQQIYNFIDSLSALISSGMNILTALSALYEDTTSKRMRAIIVDIQEGIEKGATLSQALKNTRAFPPHIFLLIEIGELSGTLDKNLQTIVAQNDKENAFRSKLRSSLLYAIIVLVLSIIIGVGTAWYILPKLADFFVQIDAPLPFLTRVLIGIGQFLATYGFIVLPLAFVVIVTLLYFLFSFPKTKLIGHRILFKIPLARVLIRNVEITRFGFLFGTMLDAGLPILSVIEALAGATTFLNYRAFYEFMGKIIREGGSIEKSFNDYPKTKQLFPASVRQMISAAEQSGTLTKTMYKIGVIYEQKTDATTRNLPVIIEPLVLLVVGIGVALLALGTLMPIYNLSGIL